MSKPSAHKSHAAHHAAHHAQPHGVNHGNKKRVASHLPDVDKLLANLPTANLKANIGIPKAFPTPHGLVCNH